MGSRAALSFVIGLAGSGKTRWCFDRIAELLRAEPIGPPVWLVTLRQATLETSRAFMFHSGLTAVSRLRVVSFDRMRDEILAECGGNALPQLTATGRRLLMSHLLRTHADGLDFFVPVATRLGTAEEICGLLDELDRAGQTVDDLAEVIRTSDDPALADPQALAKAADLVQLGHAYQAALAGRIEPRQRQQAVIDALPKCSLAERCHVFVDGFWDFDLPDRRLLRALADHAAAIHVTATVDPDTQTQPAPLERTHVSFERLRQTLDPDAKAEVIRLSTQQRWPGETRNIGQLADGWLTADMRPVSARGIQFVEASDVRAEVREVACEIRAAVRSGLRQRDCVVLMRDMATYGTIIKEVFDEHGLHYFSDQRRSAAHMPLVRLVRAVLRVALEGWPHDATMTLIKTGLAGMSLDEAQRLERYVNLHRIRGAAAWNDAQNWQFRRRPHRNEDGDPHELLPDESPALDALRRVLVKRVKPLADLLRAERVPLAAAVRTLYRTVDDLGVPDALAAQSAAARVAGNEEQAAEIEQVWQAFTDLLDQFFELLGNDDAAPVDFVGDVFAALDTLDLAIAPPTVDAVLVGEVERVRISGKPLVAVLGLSDTMFPAAPSEPVLLSDAQRRALTTHDLHLQRDSEQRLLDERLLLYHAITRTTSRLLFTRPCRTSSATLMPSTFWQDLRRLVPEAPLRTEPSEPATLHDLVARITAWAHGVADERAADLYAALRETKPAERPLIRSAWSALRYTNRPRLEKQRATALFGDHFVGSISRLETRGLCAFKHFAEYGINLADEESDELTARDIGNLFHHAAERVFAQLIEAGFDFHGPAPADLDAVVGVAVESLAGRLRGRIWMTAGRSQYERHRLQRELSRSIRQQLAFLRAGVFSPRDVEVRFGEDQCWPAPTGTNFTVRGRIDRLDTTADGLASVIDYKTGGKMFSAADFADGINVQLPVYLLAAQSADLRPAGAFYVSLRQGLERVDHPADVIQSELGPKPRGIFDAELIQHFDTDAEQESAVLQYKRTKAGKLYAGSVDPLEGDHMAQLLELTRDMVQRLAQASLLPEVRPRPWRRGKQSACAMCSLRSVCRFEPRRNGYRMSTPTSLPQLLGEADDA